jgi:phosphatidylglycerophosphate synthase
MPSLAEVRAVGQPESLHTSSGYEHWAGRLYMRRISPYLTRMIVTTPLSANAVTALLLPAGIGAALLLTVPGLWGAIGAVLLVQVWLLLDCSDGEVARWRRTFSPTGVYLDALSHSLTQGALPAALGIRADGGWGSIGGWTAAGLLASVLVLVVSLESHLAWSIAPGVSGHAAHSRVQPVRRLRDAFRHLPVQRALNPVEASLLALAAAVVDSVRDDLVGTRILVLALLAAAAVTAVGHLLVILTSDRLK